MATSPILEDDAIWTKVRKFSKSFRKRIVQLFQLCNFSVVTRRGGCGGGEWEGES